MRRRAFNALFAISFTTPRLVGSSRGSHRSSTGEAEVSVSPYYLALAGSIGVGVGAQVLLKIGVAGAESVAAQFLRVSTVVGLALYFASAVLYVIALRKMSISLAFPTDRLLRLLRAVGASAARRSHSNHSWRQPASSILRDGRAFVTERRSRA